MKVITTKLSQDIDKLELHPLADLHIGDRSCNFKDIQSELEYIKNTPNAYCVLDGDLMDTAIKKSIGDTYAQDLTPMEQLKQCVAIFAPIKDKILAVTSGNHENRIYKEDGIDTTLLMCDQLDISDRYSDTSALIYLRFGKDPIHAKRRIGYSIYMLHGNANGRKEGGKIQRLIDLAEIVDADIYISAHTHQPASLRNTFYRAYPYSDSVEKIDHLYVNTASWLEYGGYAERMGLKPGSCINPIVYLDGRKKIARCLI